MAINLSISNSTGQWEQQWMKCKIQITQAEDSVEDEAIDNFSCEERRSTHERRRMKHSVFE